MPKKKKNFPLSFPILGGRDSTRALQSSPFQKYKNLKKSQKFTFFQKNLFGNFLDFFVVVIVTNVTTKCYHGYYWTPKMGQNSIKSSFFTRRAKKASAEGRSPPQELEVGPRSGPYLLVILESCILDINSFNVALWLKAKFFSQYTEHSIFALGSIQRKNPSRSCTREYTENQLFSYLP